MTSTAILFIVVGVLGVIGGLLVVRFRKSIAEANFRLLRGLGGAAGERESNRSTPVQFMIGGVLFSIAALAIAVRGLLFFAG